MILIQSKSNIPAFNLAAEEYLFKEKKENILFVYVNEPSVIIGNNQVISNEVNLEYCEEHQIKIARRMSGGGAVYHDNGNLNYCFISNKNIDKPALTDEFLHPVVCALEKMNIPATIGKRKDLWLPGNFKVSGTASNISKLRELHHGTLLYDTDLEHLKTALTVGNKNTALKGIASVQSEVMNIKKYLSLQNYEAPETTLFFKNLLDMLLEDSKINSIADLTETDNEAIFQFQRIKYESELWTFRK